MLQTTATECTRLWTSGIGYVGGSARSGRRTGLYVVTLPIGFVATFAWWSVPVVMLVFYILVSVELIAEEIEDPFGVDENDLPLDGLCETIQGNVEEILGRT